MFPIERAAILNCQQFWKI